MSRIIKNNQIRVTNEISVKSDSKIYEDKNFEELPNSDEVIYCEVNSEIANLILEKETLVKDIEIKKQQAKAEVELILSNANTQSNEILEIANTKAQSLLDLEKERGYTKGYNEGYNNSMKEYENTINEALDIKAEVINWRKNEINILENNVINLVLESVEKIIKIRYEESDQILMNIISEGLKKFAFTQSLIIRVSDDDYNTVKFSKNKILAMADHIDELEIKVDTSLTKGEIIIDTSSGNINPSISKQLEILKDEFTKLIQNEELK